MNTDSHRFDLGRARSPRAGDGSPSRTFARLFISVPVVSISDSQARRAAKLSRLRQRTFISSSSVICACRRMLWRVFGASTRCAGTVTRSVPRLRRTCEPSCLSSAKPSRLSARTTRGPDKSRGSFTQAARPDRSQNAASPRAEPLVPKSDTGQIP